MKYLTNSLQFAIRPTSRNHTTLDRDQIINIVASAVGAPHKVDLTNYDKLILVEAFKVGTFLPCSL